MAKEVDPTLLAAADKMADDTAAPLLSLAKAVAALWNSTAGASIHHQDLLAMLEAAVITAATETSSSLEQRAFFKRAIGMLKAPCLSAAEVKEVRTEFVRQGFPPLGFIRQHHEEAV